MTNPVSRHLLQDVADPALAAWVRNWDALEALIIRTYRRRSASLIDQLLYRWLRWRLRRGYGRWRAGLAAHWRGRLAGGEPLEQDPFERLLQPASAQAFAGDWSTLQLLPAAREAVNSFLLARPQAAG